MVDPATPALCALDDASLLHPRRGRVDSVSLQVRPGTLVAVSGPSGAGKSLLLRGAIGLERVQGGTARLFGLDLARLDHDRMLELRQRVAYASLSAALLSNQSTRHNLMLPLVLRGVDRAQARQRVDAILHAFGLDGVAELRPHQFPLRLLGLAIVARALVIPAELYVLDEPSHDLDLPLLQALQREVRARKAQGAGFLLSLDDVERWRPLIDHELVLPAPASSSDAEVAAAPRSSLV